MPTSLAPTLDAASTLWLDNVIVEEGLDKALLSVFPTLDTDRTNTLYATPPLIRSPCVSLADEESIVVIFDPVLACVV